MEGSQAVRPTAGGADGAPPAAAFAAALLVSAAMLMSEILQTIVLSLQVFHQVAFLIVSLALLGLGGGGSYVVWRSARVLGDARELLWRSGLGFGVALPVCAALSARTEALGGLVALGALPYLFIGVFLAALFRAWPERASRIYFFNLLGSGLGCLGLVKLLDWTGDAGRTVLVAAALALAGVLPLSRGLGGRRAALSGTFLAAALAAIPAAPALFPYKPWEGKRYGQMLADPGVKTRLDWSKWGYLGRLDSVEPISGMERVPQSRLALEAMEAGADFRFLFASGDNWSFLTDFREAEEYRRRFVRSSIWALPYVFSEKPDVLNIGLGGGADAYMALQHGANSVAGVEINPLMIEAVRDVHPRFFGNPAADPRVTIVEMDGRTYANNTPLRFDVVTLTAVDTGAGLAAGANLLSESYLYTREAFDRYLGLLKPGGEVFVFRKGSQVPRVLATALAALRGAGAERPARHIAVVGGYDGDWLGVLFGNREFSEEQLAALRARVASGDFGGRLVWPAPEGEEGGIAVRLLRAAEEGREGEVLAALEKDYAPVPDDRPYFYLQERRFLDAPAARLLLLLLTMVTGAALVLIFLPLGRMRIPRPRGRVYAALGYFLSIGLGFMLVEVALLQKLVLYLGHPSYSMTVTLCSILIFSGLGSLAAGRFPEDDPRLLPTAFAAVLAFAAAWAPAGERVLEALGLEALWARAAATAALLAPAGFFMGMPFPTMIRRLSRAAPGLVPWAWAVNSFASVIASILTLMLAMNLGFRRVLLLGAALYALAFVCERLERRMTPAYDAPRPA